MQKAVSWSGRQIGKRPAGLYAEALALAEDLNRSEHDSARLIAKDIPRDLKRPEVRGRVRKRKTA